MDELRGAQEDALWRRIEAARVAGRIGPGAIKRVLEEALEEAGVKFLLMARPVAVWRAGDGRLAGLAVAYRTGLGVVRAGCVIDASAGGVVLRLAGAEIAARRAVGETLEWNVWATRRPEVAGAEVVATGETLVGPTKHAGQEMTVEGFRLRVPVPAGDERGRLHRLRAGVAEAAIRQTADAPWWPAEFVSGAAGAELAEDVGELTDAVLRVEPGLWQAGGVLPLTVAGARALLAGEAQVAWGRRVARAALAAVGGVEVSGGRLSAGTGAAGPWAVLPAFWREAVGEVVGEAPEYEDFGYWEVVVVGGGTGGAPAGIGAARAGARTLVLETQHGLGGVGTVGLISSYWFGNRVGFTAEVDGGLRELDPERANLAQWNPELKMAAWHRLLAEAAGEAWMQSFVFGVRRDGARVDGVLVSTPWGCGLVRAGCVIDATGSAEVAAAAGAPCRVIGAEHAAVQGTGLSPRSPGRDYCNTDHTFIDDGDAEGVTQGYVLARAKFRAEHDVATLVDSRERRQIVGELELSPLDFLAGRTFPDTVFTARSNFDTHGFTVHPVFVLCPPDKKPLEAHVPLRCMLPRGVEGVLVTGLGMSAHRDALPVIRMQADVQNQGFAAGRIAAAAARAGGSLRGLDSRPVQRGLVEAGVLAAEVAEHVDSFPLAAERVREAVAGGALDFRTAAVIFAHAEVAVPWLVEQVATGVGEAAGLDERAVVLGLLGRAEAGARLVELVRGAAWDEGWDYRGMHQFGLSLSRLDVAVIALGRTRHAEAGAVIAEKITALAEGAAEVSFSHARAVAVAAVVLGERRLAGPLGALLARPGMGGHALPDLATARRYVDGPVDDNGPRNRSLRELYVARALWACGDDAVGAYARDGRGVFARHARAVLAGATGEVDPFAVA